MNIKYPVILNGDHAEFEREHANTKPEDRPDWPLPSFDAREWAKAFCKIKQEQGWGAGDIDESLMTTWFANALMRGYDERASHSSGRFTAGGSAEAKTLTIGDLP